MPSNFDATYCYALGYAAGAMLQSGKTGLISSVSIWVLVSDFIGLSVISCNEYCSNASNLALLWAVFFFILVDVLKDF